MASAIKVVNPDQNSTYQLNSSPLDFGAYTIINAGYNNAVSGAAGTSWSVTNDGALTTSGGNSAVNLMGGGSFTNNADGTVNGGVFLTGGAGTVVNAGKLNGAIELKASGSVNNKVSGVVTSGSNNGSAVQLDGGGSVSNAGSLSGTTLGVQLADGGSLTNSRGGSISGGIVGVVGGIYQPGQATGFASQITNRAGASITGEAGVYAAGPGDTILNAGSITGTTATTFTMGATVLLGDGVSLTGAGDTVTNQYDGVITGARNGVELAGANGNVVNSGTISGVDGSVVFDGTGTNTLTLETGSTLVGDAMGSTAAGATNDLDLVGFGTANNNFDNFNALTLAAGADWTLGGTSTITTTSVEGATLDVTGTLTTAFTLGGGGTLELAKATDDSITFDGPGTLLVDKTYGGTISGFGFGDGVDFQNLSYNSDDTLSYASNGAGGGTVTISDKSSQPIATFNVTGSFASDDFVLSAAAGTGDLGVSLAASRYTTTGARQDAAYIFYPAPNSQTARGYGATHFYLVGSEVVNTGSIGDIWFWEAGNVVNEASGTINDNFSFDGYGVGLHEGGTLTNFGMVNGWRIGVQLDHGGTVNNQAGGAISGDYFGVSMSFGLAVNGTSYGGGTLLNSAGATVSGDSGVYAGGKAATVTNSGAITGNVATTVSVTTKFTFSVGDGVMLGDGGSVSNLTGDTITGARYGVFVQTATGTVANAGSITGANVGVALAAGGAVYNLAGGSIGSSGAYTAAVALASGGTVVNDGTITDSGGHVGGVYLKAGGTVENNSQITVTGANSAGQGASGIYAKGGAVAYVTNAGTIQATLGADIYLAGGGIVDNQTGANLIASGVHDSAVFLGASGQVTNAGTITGTGSYVTGVYLKNGGFADNSGTISIDVSAATKGHAAGIQLGNGGSVVNSGYVKSFGTHVGAVYSKSGGLLVNSGTLFGEADSAGYASGVDFHSGGHIDNLKGGVIEATGAHIAAVEFDAGGSVYNAGSIYANGGSSGPVDGVYGKAGARAIVTNDGSIVAKGGSNVVGVLLAGGGQVSNQNGTISGGSGVVAKNALATVYNFASISGSGKYGVYLQAGGSVTDFGSISGPNASVKFGGSAASTLTLGTGASLSGAAIGSTVTGATNTLVLQGSGVSSVSFMHFGSLNVQAGASWTLTGPSAIGMTTVDGSLTAFAGLSTIFTLDANSTLVLAAPTADNIIFNGAATLRATLDTISNDFTGSISGVNSNDTIDLLNLSNASIVSQNVLGGQTLLDLSGTVNGSAVTEQIAFNNPALAGDFALMADGNGGTRVVETTTFVRPVQTGTYTLNPAHNPIYFQAGTNINVSGATGVYGAAGTNWTVTNDGAIAGSGAASDGLMLKGSGNFTNNTGGVIRASGATSVGVYLNSGTVSNSGNITGDGSYAAGVVLENIGTVVNSGQIAGIDGQVNAAGDNGAGGVFLGHGGVVDNQQGGVISASLGTAVSAGFKGDNATYLTVDNAGTISGSGYNMDGVWSWGGGKITNEATGVITASSGVKGWGGGVSLLGVGQVINDGVIKGYGANVYGVNLIGGGTVTNSGAIAAYGANGVAALAAVVLAKGATLINLATGKIVGQVGVFQWGGVFEWGGGAPATVDNSGSITGIADGVQLKNGGSVTNAATGSITASGATSVGVYLASGTLTNSGKITADGANATGVVLENVGTVVNSGQIGTLDGAINPANNYGAAGIFLAHGGEVDNHVGGVISGSLGAGVAAGLKGDKSTYLTVDNAGTISGAGLNQDGVWSWGGGKVTNEATGIITMTGSGGGFGAVGIYGAGQVINDGVIKGYGANVYGVYLIGGGSVTNSGTIAGDGASSSGVKGGNGTSVTNTGTITDSGNYGNGVALWNGGTVTNEAGATISASGDSASGVEVKHGGAVNNYGAIDVTTTKQSGTGVQVGYGSILNNFGSIEVVATYSASGVYVMHGGTVDNSASISISGTNVSGIYGGYTSAAITNSGSISAQGTNISGIYLAAGGTISNTGSITADGVNGNGVLLGDGGTVTNETG